MKKSASFHGFADRYRLRIKHDKCGDEIIPAKLGHIYEHSNREMGLVLLDEPDGRFANTLRSRRRKAIAAGFSPHQMGDAEAILLFDGANAETAKLAIRLVEARKKRTATPAQLSNLERARMAQEVSKKAKNVCAEALESAKTRLAA